MTLEGLVDLASRGRAADQWLAGAASMDAKVPLSDGTTSVRDILVHMVEEYARSGRKVTLG